jgi:glycosyltransferase involved in cell wall biosynthesis
VTPGEHRPNVSLIIATRGRAEFRPDTLASAAAAMEDSDQLIMVESVGADGGMSAAVPYGGAIRTEHIRIDRPGKSHQLNIGVRAASNEVLLFTDDDAHVAPGWVNAMAVPFADPAVGAAFGPVQGLTMAPGFDAPPTVAAGDAPY